MIDVAIVGAGLTGLTCARQLHRMGYRIVVLEKSRGLGGRVATRRLDGSCADHGVRSLTPQGEYSQDLIQSLTNQGIVQVWIDHVYEWSQGHGLQPGDEKCPHFVAINGMTAVAKFLGTELEIWRSQRVVQLLPGRGNDRRWFLTLEPDGVESIPSLTARAIVLAIPAPQALMLVAPLITSGVSTGLVDQLRAVEFDACFSAIATYPIERQRDLEQLPWQAITFRDHPDLDWIGVENRKRSSCQSTILVIQSNARFASHYLDAKPLESVGKRLLNQAAHVTLSWLEDPVSLQVHRWRYAIPRFPCQESCLMTMEPLPLICGGDWCGGDRIESALRSGLAAANQIHHHLAYM